MIALVARGSSSSGAHSYSGSSSASRSYSSTRSSSTGQSYSSTRTGTASRSYTSTRPTRITSSNLRSTTTVSQRTTVVHNYYSDHYGYHSFFHPFGWGYGGGDFWFWMWMFDHNQYATNQQIVQAQPGNMEVVSASNHTSWLSTAGFLLGLVVLIAAMWALGRWIVRHLLWV